MTLNLVQKLWIVWFISLVAAVYITRPTPEDVAKCVASSGMSEDRCKFELSL